VKLGFHDSFFFAGAGRGLLAAMGAVGGAALSETVQELPPALRDIADGALAAPPSPGDVGSPLLIAGTVAALAACAAGMGRMRARGGKSEVAATANAAPRAESEPVKQPPQVPMPQVPPAQVPSPQVPPSPLPQALLRALVEASPDAIVVADQDLRVLMHNDRAAVLWPGAGQVIGRRIDELAELCTPALADPEAARRLVRQFVENPGLEHRRDVRLRDGRTLDSYTVPLRDEDGAPRGRIWFLRDVTAQRAAEQRSRAVARHASCILYQTRTEGLPGWEHDLDGQQRLFSAAAVHVLDEEAAQRVLPLDLGPGQSYWDAWRRSRLDDDLPEMARRRARALIGGEPSWTQTFRCRDRDGQVRWLHEVVSVQRVAPGRWETFGVCTDVTELHRVQAALQESERRFRLFMENLPGPAFIKDAHGRHLYLNRAAKADTGVTRDDQWLGRPAMTTVDRDTAAQFTRNDRRVLREDRPLQVIEFVPLADGPHAYLVNKFPFVDAAGQQVIGGVALDITRRLRAERALRVQKRVLETVTEASPVAVLFAGPDGRWELFNQKFAQLWRLPDDVVTGRDHLRGWALAREQVAEPQRWFPHQGRLDSGADDAAVDVLTLHDGRTLVRTSVAVQTGPDDADAELFGGCGAKDEPPRGVARVTFFQDVTGQERDKQQLRFLAWQLTQTQERERRRIAGLLHDDVGQTLALAQMRIDALQQQAATSAPLPAGATDIAAALGELQRMLAHVTGITRSLTGQLSPPVLYELGLLPAVRSLAWQLLEPRGIRVECDFADARQPGDERRVIAFQAVRELFVNILKHSRANNVKLRARESGEMLCLSVEDDGVGCEVSRGSTPARGEGSTRFGLFNLREQLHYAGGTFTLESEPGRFTRSTLTIPL
jgi:PAS domain S-box-containing protein